VRVGWGGSWGGGGTQCGAYCHGDRLGLLATCAPPSWSHSSADEKTRLTYRSKEERQQAAPADGLPSTVGWIDGGARLRPGCREGRYPCRRWSTRGPLGYDGLWRWPERREGTRLVVYD